jgi:hypothetical protein
VGVDRVGAVGDDVLGGLVDLVPLVEALDVDGAHLVAVREELVDEVSSDESTSTGDEYGHLLPTSVARHRDIRVPTSFSGTKREYSETFAVRES